MTLLPHGTLPLATTAAFIGSGRAPLRDAGAWTQALARATAGAAPAAPAAASGWKTPGAPAPDAPLAVVKSPAAPAPAASPNIDRTVLSGQPRALALALTAVARARAADADPARALPANAFAANAASEPPVTESVDDGLHLPRARAPAAEAMGSRVHVEWHDDGLAIWLGLDAGPQAATAQAAGLLDALRRQGGVLPRLVLLVCNGVPILTHPHPPRSKETP